MHRHSMTKRGSLWSRSAGLLFGALMLGLGACGGSNSGTVTSDQVESRSSDEVQQGARLNGAELAAAERRAVAEDRVGSATNLEGLLPGQVAAKSAYQSGAVARKAVATRIPVYRFFNASTGAHFFTTSVTERDNVINQLSPPYQHEGEAFSVASDYSPGLSPVHRFYNTQTGVHFYTISETERAHVASNLPQFRYEGVAYHASQVAGQGLLPFYRFYVPSRGFHFYTANETEKASIQANLAATYLFEGVGYYVLDTRWSVLKLPHSGVSNQQCYKSGSNLLVACNDALSLALNPQQDGHRTAVNPASYAAVGSHGLDECVRDEVTGLVWEGKAASGARAGSNTYTHLGNSAGTDTSGYVAMVNASQLCGYSDWRLPRRNELLMLVDYARSVAPVINTAWFPNTAATSYWSADGLAGDTTQAWFVQFSTMGGSSFQDARTNQYGVRLVRGVAPVGQRFSYGSVTDGSDAAGNLVNDAWTGLQWRRCVEGKSWNGSTCTGSGTQYQHEAALVHARNRTGWRLPNIKELVSLLDTGIENMANVDATAFPGNDSSVFWSASPFVGNTDGAWIANFGGAYVDGYMRYSSYQIRLVRAEP